MKRVLVFIISIGMLSIYNSCDNATDGIVFPSVSVRLIFPTNNLLCTDKTITFDWDDVINSSSNNVSYNIIIAKNRSLTDIVVNKNIVNSEITLTLDKGIAYYWKVIVNDTRNNTSTDTQIFSFYTKEDGITNYSPFASQLASPSQNSQVTSGSINLNWSGSDPDVGDALTYQLYFGETNNPSIVENSLATESYTVTVATGKTYFWKVNTIDQNGAKSIGQIWSFSVN